MMMKEISIPPDTIITDSEESSKLYYVMKGTVQL
jgi:hypothetical protein